MTVRSGPIVEGVTYVMFQIRPNSALPKWLASSFCGKLSALCGWYSETANKDPGTLEFESKKVLNDESGLS